MTAQLLRRDRKDWLPVDQTSPASISTMRFMVLNKVVLPQPLGPRMMVSSPSGMMSETSSTATVAPKRLVTCRN